MLKAKKYDWKDSNMSLFGSDTEKKVKKESAESEPAWQGAGQEVGVKVWRIVKFKVEHWPEEQNGEFFNGDTYIILNTYKEEESDELKYDVHFWIGKYSTQDEYGTAAYKTVELDTFLDDKPIQHREVQGHESKLFKSYFEAMKLMKGGADTGFRRVLPENYTPRMFHVKKVSAGNIVCNEVSMKKGNLKSGDVFIIDNGKKIYQWNGSECSHDEKFAAAAEINKMKESRNASVTQVDEEHCSDSHPAVMLLKDGESKEKGDVPQGERKMFEISEEDGDDSMEEIAADDAISKDLLKSGNVYIINTGDDVWCWVGSEASIDERKNSMAYACNYINKTETPWLPVTVVAEGSESQQFKESF